MIGAGILALTGQIAELAGSLFPLVFLAAAVVTSFSALLRENVQRIPLCRGHRYVSRESLWQGHDDRGQCTAHVFFDGYQPKPGGPHLWNLHDTVVRRGTG